MRPALTIAVAIGFVFAAFAPGDTPKIVVMPADVIHAELFGSTIKLFLSREKSAEIAPTGAQGLTVGFADMKIPGDIFKGMFIRAATFSSLECTVTFQFSDDAAAKLFYDAF